MHQILNQYQELVHAEWLMCLMGVLRCEDHAADIVQERQSLFKSGWTMNRVPVRAFGL